MWNEFLMTDELAGGLQGRKGYRAGCALAMRLLGSSLSWGSGGDRP